MTKVQGMQKAQHNTKAKETKYTIGESVMAKNYHNSPKWVPGVIVEQLGTLTFLVQIDNGMFWKRHVDQLCGREQSSNNTSGTETAYTSKRILEIG